MSDEPDDEARQALFHDLAERLATPEGLATARRLQAAGLLSPTPRQAAEEPSWPAPSPGRRRARPISIWQPEERDGERVFVRPPPLPFGDHYAATEEIRPKRSELPLRVAFFGESVAAGYLYAPHLTPAQVLADDLRSAAGEGAFEVIDLARTNETLPTLAATVESAVQVQPDMLVVFAGNNWNLLETPEVSPYAPSVRARQSYAEALAGGLQGPVRRADAELEEIVERTFAHIALIAGAIGVPVIVVVPEVNLADWENRQPAAWLPGDGVARWHEQLGRATAALAEGDAAAAIGAAEAMLALDGGSGPTAWRLLALAHRARGDRAAELRAAREEVDSTRYPTLAFLSAPQVTTRGQALLRSQAERHGFALVDLPEVFSEHTGGEIPGRRLFLDYCHLTREGIAVAMAAVAARVLSLSGTVAKDVTWQELLPRLPEPEIAPEAEAVARFGAAIHGAHRLLTVGPKAPILEHWCRAALDASPGIESAMMDLVAARCAPLPAVLTAAQRRNFDSPYRLLLQHGWQYDHLDADVIEAIAEALESRGRDVREVIHALLLAHRAVGEDGTDLADPFYHWEPLARFYPEVMRFDDLPRRATYRSPWPESTFCLVTDAARDLILEPTVRLPSPLAEEAADRKGQVRVVLNGVPVGSFSAIGTWTRPTLLLNRQHLRRGLNRLTLRWPLPTTDGVAALTAAIARLQLGISADLHPVFGELFSLLVRRS